MGRREKEEGQEWDILFQAPLELLLPFPLLKHLPPSPFFIQPLLPLPLIPSYFLHLESEKEHHVAIRRLMGVCP